MKKMNAMEMRNVEGGATVKCDACGKKFRDIKFLWWVIMSAKKQLKSHKATCWGRHG